MPKRFTDQCETVYSFADETLVYCPGCGGCARSSRIDKTSTDWFAPRRLACSHCGYADAWAEREISRGWRNAADDYFELPLWLQAPCCSEVLWAYNLRHLDFIERFVCADLRKRTADPRHGWMNASLASRLPKWLKSAKNRDEILRTIRALRKRPNE